MKFSSIRWLFVAGSVSAIVAGVVSSNVGCGSDNGKAGSGGSSGGTSGGGSGGAVPARYINTFDTDKQGWQLSTYVEPAANNRFNWGSVTDPDSGVGLDGGVAPTIEWTGDDGDPNPGALKVTVTFTGFNQYIDPQVNLATPMDFTGVHKSVKARVRLASGTFPAGGVQFHVSSGATYVYASAPFVNSSSFPLGTWVTVPLDTSTVSATGFDPTQIVQIGIQFSTGDAFEGGTVTFGQAVFEIDTVQA